MRFSFSFQPPTTGASASSCASHGYGNSLRVVKVWGADRTFYLYAGTQLISEFEDAASNTYSAGTTPGQAPADSTTTMLYQHSDHLTTRLTTDNFGNLSNDQAHYPYGEQWYSGGTANPSVLRKFTSYQKEDEATSGKLNYAVFREHSARIGRFHMADPKRGKVRNPQRLNRYAYVTGNPVMRTDRRGLDGEDDGLVHGDDPLLIVDGGIMPSQAFGYVGGYVGARDAWLAAQMAEADRMNTIPVGCWDGSGYRNEACVRAQENGGDPSPRPVVTIRFLSDDPDAVCREIYGGPCYVETCATLAAQEFESCAGNLIWLCGRSLVANIASCALSPLPFEACAAAAVARAGIFCSLLTGGCAARAAVRHNLCMAANRLSIPD